MAKSPCGWSPLWQHHKIGGKKKHWFGHSRKFNSLSQTGALDSLDTTNKECVKEKLSLNKENVAYNNVHPFSMRKKLISTLKKSINFPFGRSPLSFLEQVLKVWKSLSSNPQSNGLKYLVILACKRWYAIRTQVFICIYKFGICLPDNTIFQCIIPIVS